MMAKIMKLTAPEIRAGAGVTPELRARLLEWKPASAVDAPDAYPPGYDGPLDERTPGVFKLSTVLERMREQDRERIIGDFTD